MEEEDSRKLFPPSSFYFPSHISRFFPDTPTLRDSDAVFFLLQIISDSCLAETFGVIK